MWHAGAFGRQSTVMALRCWLSGGAHPPSIFSWLDYHTNVCSGFLLCLPFSLPFQNCMESTWGNPRPTKTPFIFTPAHHFPGFLSWTWTYSSIIGAYLSWKNQKLQGFILLCKRQTHRIRYPTYIEASSCTDMPTYIEKYCNVDIPVFYRRWVMFMPTICEHLCV